MIDYVKVRINNLLLHQRLLHDARLTFYRGRDRYTSDKYHNLQFILHDSGTVEVKGSLHKYWNQGAHNWNDFTRVDLWDTIHELCQWLEIEPREAVLHNVEFGVNLTVPFSPKTFLADLIAYKKEPFGKVPVPKQGTYQQAATFAYFVKCYDKGSQYDRKENLLRFEIKVRVMRYLHGVEISTLHDLLIGSKLAALGVLLFDAWQSVLIREELPADKLTGKEQDIVKAVTDPSRWQQLTRKQRHTMKQTYTQLVEHHLHGDGTPSRKTVVENLLREKWDQLLTGDVCNDLQPAANTNPKGRLQRSSIVCKRTDEEPAPPTTPQQSRHNHGTSRPVEQPAPPPPTTAQQQHRRHKRKRTHHPEEYYLKHNERNRRSNPPNNLRRSLQRAFDETTLFDPLEVIRLKPEQAQLLTYFKGTPREIKGL